MMIFTLSILIIIAFFIRTTRNVFYQCFLWQLKEYRVDRMIAHLKTSQGNKLPFGSLTLLKWVILFILVGIVVSSYVLPTLLSSFLIEDIIAIIYYFFWFIWLLEASLNVKELVTAGWRIPKITFKIILILLTTFTIQFGVLTIDKQAPLILGPLLDKLLAPTVAFFVMFFNGPSLIFKKIIIVLAKRKIAGLKNLFVIGITGSYGKTSTKEFLATILSEKFKVAKTPESNNTEIGIAKYILKGLETKHEVFVVEMGAYKKGEIKEICEMVKPKMGIITGINEQHLELFGSIENTKKAKYELIESLSNNGIAIFNGDNFFCLEMAKFAKERKLDVLIYRIKKNVKNIKVFKSHFEFIYIDDYKKEYKFRVNLLGKQNLENILGAIYAVHNLKMNFDEIKQGIAKITSPDKTMKLYKFSSGAALVDDSFNANPDGVISALEYMRLYEGKKILVLTPLIELGKEGERIHLKLGREARKVCDLILLTNSNFEKSFREGVREEKYNQKVKVVATTMAVEIIKNLASENSIVVFEGKESGKILKKLKIKNYV